MTSSTGELKQPAIYYMRKDHLKSKMNEAIDRIKVFEEKYNIKFDEFFIKYNSGTIENINTAHLEHDLWEWDSALKTLEKYKKLYLEM